MATIEIKTRLIELQDIECFIHNPIDADQSLVNNDEYAARIDTAIAFSEEEQTVAITLVINLRSRTDSERDSKSKTRKHASAEDQLPSLRYKGAAKFSLGGDFKLELETSSSGKGYNVPTQLMVKLGEITYSTFRGIIFSKSSGTALKNVMLPILSSKQVAMFITPEVTQ